MKYMDIIARELKNKFCCFRIDRNWEWLENCPERKEADCFLTYGFSGHEKGFSFELLSLGRKEGVQNYQFFEPARPMIISAEDLRETDFEIIDPEGTDIYLKYKMHLDLLNQYDSDLADHEPDLKEYRRQLVEYLNRQVGKETQETLMKTYEGEWQDFAKSGWEVEVLGIGMIHGL